jgi:unsaturated rhamnogalacturonyl hydrolase
MADGVVLQHVNGIAPGPALLAVHAEDGDPEYLELAVELGDLLVDEYPKIDRAFEHAPGQLWVDTTFMSAPFLVELGHVSGDDTYTDLGVDQVLVHGDRLQRDDGLWHHGWVKAAADAGQDPLNGVMWARGNGWAAASTVEVLERLPDDDPRVPELEARLRSQLETVLQHQSEDGGWTTIVDDPATYLESSGSALLARALLVADRRRVLEVDDAAIDHALAWLETQSDADGRLRGVSGPTVLSSDPAYYADRPTADAEPYAQGAYLLLLSEPK